jgi:hypothetical protein
MTTITISIIIIIIIIISPIDEVSVTGIVTC